MKRIQLANTLIIIALVGELVWAQGSCCQQGSNYMNMGSNSITDPHEISFTTIKGDTYNLAKEIGSEPMLIFRMGSDKSFDSRAALVNKARSSIPESNITFIGVMSDTSSKSLAHIKKLKLNFPVVLDPDNKLISKFGLSEKSPAVIFLNQDGEVVQTSSEVNESVLAQGIAVATAPVQVVDPVCQMPVNKKTAAETFEYQDKTYYFCSQACKKLFEEAPAKYLNK
jgi:YHS domain-containing protein/peroxiredoxin